MSEQKDKPVSGVTIMNLRLGDEKRVPRISCHLTSEEKRPEYLCEDEGGEIERPSAISRIGILAPENE